MCVFLGRLQMLGLKTSHEHTLGLAKQGVLLWLVAAKQLFGCWRA
jgi:hypothetical protein